MRVFDNLRSPIGSGMTVKGGMTVEKEMTVEGGRDDRERRDGGNGGRKVVLQNEEFYIYCKMKTSGFEEGPRRNPEKGLGKF